MTSNVGSTQIAAGKSPLGFQLAEPGIEEEDAQDDHIENLVKDELKRWETPAVA